MFTPLVSILINNYNYGRFLGAAIESALSQDYPSIEIVVVDDGSTDNSRDIIDRYAGRIISVIKENGGQASAFNAGFAASQGEILCFLDADDLFNPEKVGRVVKAFLEQGLNSRSLMVHHLLAVKNETGKEIRELYAGRTHTSPMNLYDFAKRHRCLYYEAGPTTTLSINRALANRLFPIPEKGVRVSADDFVVLGASLVGELHSLQETLGSYRVHGHNNWYGDGRPKPPEYKHALETYLNAKLSESGLEPVISYEKSMHAWPGLRDRRQWIRLYWLMLRVCFRDRDRKTFAAAYHTTIEIGMMAMKTIRRKRAALLGKHDERQRTL